MMRITILTMAATLALAACSSTGDKKLAVCDGKHLRPANPYGTVLALPPEGGMPPRPAEGAEAKPKTLSSIGSSALSGGCRT